MLLASGDASDKAVAEALEITGIQASLGDQAGESRGLPDIARMLANYISQHTHRYATMVFGILDPRARTFTYINAGHNPPLLRHDQGSLERLGAGGPPIGLLPDIHYAEQGFALQPGDRLLFYTDGLTDPPNRHGATYGHD